MQCRLRKCRANHEVERIQLYNSLFFPLTLRKLAVMLVTVLYWLIPSRYRRSGQFVVCTEPVTDPKSKGERASVIFSASALHGDLQCCQTNSKTVPPVARLSDALPPSSIRLRGGEIDPARLLPLYCSSKI